MLKQIGKYTIGERIGRGARSRVYRAVDQQGRPVAIKVSTTETESEHLAAFQNDLLAAASVLHPNLVAVHDLGFEGEFPYLVMELVAGQDLDKLLKNHATVSLAERIRVMQQVADALKSAHERGVYHLDLRPSKIMLGDDGIAKLLNLGLGRFTYDPDRVTEHGYLVGSPFYMSPERLTAIDTAGAQCDIWSFGVTFYEWIAGHHPFYDDDGDRMIGNIMDMKPANLAGAPAALNRVILRAIEKDPAERYESFTELLADIRPMVSDLKREESDALLAEALKQTDSGRWHEARRIARKLREMEPPQAAHSQIFGVAEFEPDREAFAEPPAAEPEVAPASAPVVAAVEEAKPEPEPYFVAPVEEMPPAMPAIDLPRPASGPRPRATPGARMGSTQGSGRGLRRGAELRENGAPNGGRAQPAEPVANGARIVTAPVMAREGRSSATGRSATEGSGFRSAPVEAAPAAVRQSGKETRRESSRETKSERRARPSASGSLFAELEPEQGLPWGRISAFLFSLLLIGGVLFFLVRSDSKFLRLASAGGAKKVAPAEESKPADENPPETGPASDAANGSSKVAAGDSGGLAIPAPETAPETASAAPAARVFDPKTLPRLRTVARRRTAPSLGWLVPPALNGNPDVSALPAPPLALKPPPAFAPPAQTASLAASSAAGAQTPQSRAAKASFAEPVLIHAVQPIYPPSAVQRKAQGVVRFQATIAKDGSVKNLQLMSGDPLLNVAAKEAVLQWKYRPAVLNGQIVEVTQAIVVRFNLNP